MPLWLLNGMGTRSDLDRFDRYGLVLLVGAHCYAILFLSLFLLFAFLLVFSLLFFAGFLEIMFLLPCG